MTEHLIGQRFGRLTIQSVRESRPAKWKHYFHALCRCDCGAEKEIRLDHLKSGATKSCGCMHRGVTVINNSTHGMTRNRQIPAEFHSWSAMLERCFNPNNPAYPGYGGRGITVCERWRFGEGGKSAFECFFADMGPRGSRQMTLERENNDGNYEPSNCKWADKREQASNRRSTKRVFAWGQSMTLAEALRRASISEYGYYNRLKRGLSETEALEMPSRKKGGGFRRLRATTSGTQPPSPHR